MKILHVAVFSEHSTNVWQAKAFEKLECEVIRFDYRRKAQVHGIVGRDYRLVQLCRKFKPDISIFAKCNQMDVNVVEECRKVSATVMWMPDRGPHINTEFKTKLSHCDFVFCSAQDVVDIARQYCSKSYRLQGGYDPDVHHPIDVPKRRDVVFIGNINHPMQRDYRTECKMKVNFEVVTGVYNKDHSRVVSESRINLSFNRGKATSNRIYKLMAAKGFVLTMPWAGMEEDFVTGVHLDIFRDPEELKRKIKHYLENPWVRERIAEAGYKKVKEYDNINYAKRILEAVSNYDRG